MEAIYFYWLSPCVLTLSIHEHSSDWWHGSTWSNFPLLLEVFSQLKVFFFETFEIQCIIACLMNRSLVWLVERVIVEVCRRVQQLFRDTLLVCSNCLLSCDVKLTLVGYKNIRFSLSVRCRTFLSNHFIRLPAESVVWFVINILPPCQDLEVLYKFILLPTSLYLYMGSLFVYFWHVFVLFIHY